jgi:hypothetical protein
MNRTLIKQTVLANLRRDAKPAAVQVERRPRTVTLYS